MSRYNVIEHVVPGQHFRELPNALAVDEHESLHLAVKQYVPKRNPGSQIGDLTIIALHANSFTKEIYEPLWDDILDSLPSSTRIRGIWAVDIAQQGASYVMNEQKLADGISWDDHSRDILHIINHFRDQMTQPMIGIGHSMGGAQLVGLCNLHPRLFHAVALLDPFLAISFDSVDKKGYWKRGTNRKDRFANLQAVRDSYSKAPLFKAFDPRAFEIYMRTALRPAPTMLHNDNPGENVALATPTAMEMYTASRVNLDGINTDSQTASRIDRLMYPELWYDAPTLWPYYQPNPVLKGRSLRHLRPRVLFLYGAKSAMKPQWQKENHEQTGTLDGGSGGARLGCVESETIKGSSHFFPFEKPKEAGHRLAEWLGKEAKVWTEEREVLRQRYGAGRPADQRQRVPKAFHDVTRDWASRDDTKTKAQYEERRKRTAHEKSKL